MARKSSDRRLSRVRLLGRWGIVVLLLRKLLRGLLVDVVVLAAVIVRRAHVVAFVALVVVPRRPLWVSIAIAAHVAGGERQCLPSRGAAAHCDKAQPERSEHFGSRDLIRCLQNFGAHR